MSRASPLSGGLQARLAARLLAASILLTGSSPLGPPPTRAAPPPTCKAIVGATVFGLGAKRLDGHHVAIVGETITAVSAGSPPPGCELLDASGQLLTAGFIDPWTTMGLVEIDGESSTVDTDNRALHQDAQGAIRAAVRTSLGFDWRSTPIAVARLGGVTSAISHPTGGLIAGQAFWVDLAGASRRDTIQRDPVAFAVILGARAESRAAGLFALDVALREAVLFRRHRAALEKLLRAPLLNSALDLAALGPVIDGVTPLVVSVERASEIASLFEVFDRLSEDEPGARPRLVLVGASEGWQLADELARRKVAVIIDPLLFGPGSFDQLAARRDHAAFLAARGVDVMVSPMDSHLSKKLRQLVGNAVREGLSWEQGLLAVTETPARVFGLARHGRIAVGAKANLVLWSGDPFELSTRVEAVFIAGQRIPLRSRQSELFDRWRTLPPAP